MKSLNEWRLESRDPDWEQLIKVWGSGSKPVDPTMLMMMRTKIDAIQDRVVKQLSQAHPEIKTFRDVPPQMRDALAQSLVVATLHAFYSAMGPSTTGTKTQFNPKKLGNLQNATPDLPQDNIDSPKGWKG